MYIYMACSYSYMPCICTCIYRSLYYQQYICLHLLQQHIILHNYHLTSVIIICIYNTYGIFSNMFMFTSWVLFGGVTFKYSTCSRQNRLVHPQQYCILKVQYTVNSTTATSSWNLTHYHLFHKSRYIASLKASTIPLSMITNDDSSLE